ncbi:MAG TPA: hypothetical protein VHY84_03595 [Bryobacteraceae bacterium]|jgi:hypothetical protein|nr:hypothetical protein [Bryobacteraceae bacterium]
MSDQPSSVPDSDEVVESPADPAITPPGKGWFQRLSSVLFIIFCFELGLFLLIYPWTDGWGDNYFAWAVRGSVQTTWHSFWNNSFVRGGISGVGAINLWIAVTEVFRMFSRRKS